MPRRVNILPRPSVPEVGKLSSQVIRDLSCFGDVELPGAC